MNSVTKKFLARNPPSAEALDPEDPCTKHHEL